MPIHVCGDWRLTAEYRFFGVGSRKYNVATQAAAAHPVAFGTAKLGNDFNHSVMIGLRYNFDQPPPPPPPAPAAARHRRRPARIWCSSIGTRRPYRSRAPDHQGSGRQLDQGAVHADRGERLHRYLRHAASTTKACRSAVPRRWRRNWSRMACRQNAITIQGFGDTHLLVPTGPGVREPQNRRVEIIIR